MFCRFICSISFCCHGKSLIRQRRRNKSGPCGWKISGLLSWLLHLVYHRISRYIIYRCMSILLPIDQPIWCWPFLLKIFAMFTFALWSCCCDLCKHEAKILSGSRQWLVGRPFEEITDRLSWVTQGGRIVCFVVWKLLRKSSATCSELTKI